jgi:hypothetical protein
LPACFGVFVQYPGASGQIIDPSAAIEQAHAHGGLAIVAADLFATRSNALAAPIWQERKLAFRKLLVQRKISAASLIRLQSQWRSAVRDAGIAAKAARRQGEAAAFQLISQISRETEIE